MRHSNVKLDGYTIDFLLREYYEDTFGISDLDDPNEPLALIRYTNADTLGDLGSIAEAIKQFRINELGEKYNISIKEYFDMPVDVCKLLISNARTEKQDLDNIVDTADRNANREWKNK